MPLPVFQYRSPPFKKQSFSFHWKFRPATNGTQLMFGPDFLPDTRQWPFLFRALPEATMPCNGGKAHTKIVQLRVDTGLT
ncbi:hypothetical protein [Pseudoflavitalea rhizosphaerae]|uniref:hypothetical protein n=1 Tax=Pseudoflavitalea rhizosphaerae TaxID=1884793 RepID=UPI000F8F2991|nr:hypothetical protein [Pseudoflavitalea rhizosphaerae]